MNRVVALLSLLAAFASGAQSQGPVGKLYLTDWIHSVNYVVQGPNVINSAPQVPPAARCLNGCPLFGEIAIALPGSVRTMGLFGPGSDYTYDLAPTGARYNLVPVSIFDGTSDGEHIYAVSSNQVYAFDYTWANGKVIFTYFNGDDLSGGITYDPSNNSLWLSSSSGQTVYDVSMSGQLISQFTVPFNNICALAMDVDGTLWMSSLSTGTFYHYDRNGNSLGIVHYTQLQNIQTYGGEILQENQANSTTK